MNPTHPDRAAVDPHRALRATFRAIKQHDRLVTRDDRVLAEAEAAYRSGDPQQLLYLAARLADE